MNCCAFNCSLLSASSQHRFIVTEYNRTVSKKGVYHR
jgi:hypothetical protein